MVLLKGFFTNFKVEFDRSTHAPVTGVVRTMDRMVVKFCHFKPVRRLGGRESPGVLQA